METNTEIGTLFGALKDHFASAIARHGAEWREDLELLRDTAASVEKVAGADFVKDGELTEKGQQARIATLFLTGVSLAAEKMQTPVAEEVRAVRPQVAALDRQLGIGIL